MGIRKKPREIEHQHQAALFGWAKSQIKKYPQLDMLFAIPNGGQRHPAVAAKLKAEGVRAGMPDICLPVPCGGYHGLWIELKAPGGNGQRRGELSEAQRDRLDALAYYGYRTAVAWGWDEAAAEIQRYLEQI